MAFTIKHDLNIPASKATVWNVITDLKRYGEWNQFVVACESTLAIKSPIRMQVRVLPFFAMPQKETIFDHQPGQKLSYGISMPFGILSSYREHFVETNNSGSTRYRSRFELSGGLAPIVRLLLRKQLQRGFDDMANGIKQRSMQLEQIKTPESGLTEKA